MARLLAEALQPAASAEAAGYAACPDAELMAAYADQGLAKGPGKGLDNDERERLEGHFAACGRCQEILAVLAVKGEDPLTEPEVRQFAKGASEASAPARPTTSTPPARPAQRWFWWLAPALGTAAAAMLWMVLRPASPGGTAPVQTAADYLTPAQQETRALSTPGGVPAPPAEASPAAALRREAPSPDGNLSARADRAAEAKQEEARDETAALSLAAPDETASAAPAARSAVAGNEAAPLNSGITRGVTVTEQLPSVATANDARADVAPAPAQPAAGPRGAILGGTLSQEPLRELPLSGRSVAQLNLYTFLSPDGSVLWRLGAGGSIERSTDRGQTWQQQTSGVTTALVSGSAASKDVAWVVGRAGVILRTTDGELWQRIAPPNGATGDWAAVVAYDALTATVVAADLRRFWTQDGGRTWTQQ